MIILTGGAGFIGSCFLAKLNGEGIKDVLVVDHLDGSEKWKNLVGKKFTDYMQKSDFLELVKEGDIPKPEKIVHIGACSSTTCTDADYFLKNNYEYSKILAEWAVSEKVPFLYASSAATYGSGERGYSDDDAKLCDLCPLNMYGYSKQMFDMWVMRNKLINKVTGFKFFNVYGPNEYHKGEMMSVVCKKFSEVDKEGTIRLFKSYNKEYPDGGQKRDFIYVKDVVDIMFYFFRKTAKTGIFNVGTGEAKTWNDLAGAMFKAVGKKANIQYIEMPEYLRPKYQYFTEADISKLRKAGYKQKFMSFDEAVKDYVTNYLVSGKYM
ncbi:MAG TPA: ADP-glyceromanno-heptose 6-epimerase [Candidatus Omnitrophota bacterium]|nr:ADP-glyceromanno-heptose 6-epimerase [Candidatus Omnitrophota bacterium]HPS19679.1 ADP-glyceromanno-heptose 6-epimerase [Candidatus Omnitrophota bacterium]